MAENDPHAVNGGCCTLIGNNFRELLVATDTGGFRSSNSGNVAPREFVPIPCTIRIRTHIRTSSTCTPTCVLPRRVAYPSSVVYVWMAAPYLCGDGLRQKTTSWKSMKICGPTSPRSVPMWVLLSRGSLWNVRYVASSSDIY